MSEAVCPICATSIPIRSNSAFIFNQIRCAECGTLLEILNRTTLELGEVEEAWDAAAGPARYDRVNRSAKGVRASSAFGRRNA